MMFSVREFAQPNVRRGDIDMLSGYRPNDGSEIHRVIQQRLLTEIPNYSSELQVQGSFFHAETEFKIKGRVDGLIKNDDHWLIEEIKSTANADRLIRRLREDSFHPYLLQLRTYGYLLSGDGPKIALRFRISSPAKEEILDVPWDLEAYIAWRDERAAWLLKDRVFWGERDQRRRAAAARMVFPFDSVREPQQQLMEAVREATRSKQQLLVQAPTGLGKTAGVMFPMLQAALAKSKQLISLTPKNSQHRLFEEVLAKIEEKQELGIRSLTMTAKSKICMQAEPVCTPDHCPYAKKYYDKCSENSIIEKLRDERHIDAVLLKKYAETYEVCPFELSLECTRDVDVVIGDLNYVFSPRSRLDHLLVDEQDESRHNFLMIDEVHNLSSRLSDSCSPEIEMQFFDRLLESTLPENLDKVWKKILTRCKSLIASHTQSLGQPREQIQFDTEDFLSVEMQIHSFCMQYLSELKEPVAQDPVLRLQRAWSDFCFSLDSEINPHAYLTARRDTPSPSLKITCADASMIGREALKHFACVVGFSATVKPFHYHAELCGFDKERLSVKEFPSPFDPRRRKLLVIPQINTRFKAREQNYPKIAEAITRICQRKKGNYFVFAPSFDFLSRLAPLISVPGFRLLKQEPFMSHADAQEILDRLSEQSRGVIVLAVQGGIFAEGVDYPGDLLIGAFIVGPGLPAFEFERELVRKFYDERFGDGFAFAYTYPGMTRVIQAAGRVIRREEDRGLIVLMDDRFLSYTELMPSDWQGPLTSSSILADIDRFWDEG